MTQIEARLSRIEARSSISDLVARYAHGADRKNDPAIMRALFHDDANWSAEGFSAFQGADAIAAGLSTIAQQQVLWSIHYMISPYIDLSPDGLSARCHWYLWELATMANDEGYQDQWLGGWYESIVTLKDEEWKFSSVKLDLRLQGMANPPWHVKKGFDQ